MSNFYQTTRRYNPEESHLLKNKTCPKWKYKMEIILTGSNMFARSEDQAFTEDHSSTAYGKLCNIKEMYCIYILLRTSLNLVLATEALSIK
jgi:hypothetical protein